MTRTTYHREHLAPAYEHAAPVLVPVFIHASRAHVVGLHRSGLITEERATSYLRALAALASRDVTELLPAYDGTFEDAYYALEKQLAAQLKVETADLSLQLGRSRNDLDAAAFRIILRNRQLELAEEVDALITAVIAKSRELTGMVIIGYTHRRPAQPTTAAHVIAGYAESLQHQQRRAAATLAQLRVSPLGACAFAGSDLPLERELLSDLLGFQALHVNSYESVAGAEVYADVAADNAALSASAVRVTRTLLDWLTTRWFETPAEFCQGSSIMPQKQNPVVLEHLVSYAGETISDAQAVSTLIASSWWEDSNNATTDVQARLWASNSRTLRFVRLLTRFFDVLTPLSPPSSDEIVESGTTTTAVADALALAGVPFRQAHSVTGRLSRARDVRSWDLVLMRETVDALDLDLELDDAALELVLAAAHEPERVLRRAQADGPGEVAVRAQLDELDARQKRARSSLRQFRSELEAAELALVDAEAALLAGNSAQLSDTEKKAEHASH